MMSMNATVAASFAPTAMMADHERVPYPREMMEKPRWMLHIDKVPHYATGARRTTTETPSDTKRLVMFDVANAALEASDRYTGLSYALGDGIWGIDLDDVVDESGKVTPWAAEILAIARRDGLYIEKSMSGTGFHIFGRGELGFKGFRRSDRDVEVYDHGRHFAMTGKGEPIDGALGEMTDELREALLERAGKKEGAPYPAEVPAPLERVPSDWLFQRHDAGLLLQHLDPDMSYPDWIKVGMALHHASGGGREGLELFESWSARGSKYTPDEADSPANKWASFGNCNGSPITFGTLVDMSKKAQAERQGAPQGPAEAPVGAGAADVSGAPAVMPEWLRRINEWSPPPVERLTAVPELEYYVDGLIPIRVPGCLVAPGSTGKTGLMLDLAIATALGGKWLARQVAEGSFVLLSLDDHQDELDGALARVVLARKLEQCQLEQVSQRVRIISLRGAIEDPSFAVTLSGGAPLATLIEQQIADALSGIEGLRCVVVDTLRQFAGGDTNAGQVMTIATKAVTRLADSLGCAVLVMHHMTKEGARSGEVDQYSGSGSGALGDNLRLVFVLTEVSVKEVTERLHVDSYSVPALEVADKLLKLVDTRGSLLRKALGAIYVKRDGFVFSAINGRLKSEAERVEDQLVAVLAAIRDGHGTGLALQDSLHCRSSTASSLLKEAIEAGLAIRQGNKPAKLTEAGRIRLEKAAPIPVPG